MFFYAGNAYIYMYVCVCMAFILCQWFPAPPPPRLECCETHRHAVLARQLMLLICSQHLFCLWIWSAAYHLLRHQAPLTGMDKHFEDISIQVRRQEAESCVSSPPLSARLRSEPCHFLWRSVHVPETTPIPRLLSNPTGTPPPNLSSAKYFASATGLCSYMCTFACLCVKRFGSNL